MLSFDRAIQIANAKHVHRIHRAEVRQHSATAMAAAAYAGSVVTFPMYNSAVAAADAAKQTSIAASEERRRSELRKISIAMLRLGAHCYANADAARAAVASVDPAVLVDLVEVAPARA